MITAVATAARRPVAGALHRPHPGWWLWIGSGAAWVGLLWVHATGHGRAGHHGHHGHGTTTDVPWVVHWTLMVAAMMWPLWTATAAAVGRASFRRWRPANVATLIAATSVLWIGAGLAARVAFLAVDGPRWWLAWSAGWLAVGVVATWSSWRWRLLRRCSRLGVLAPGGRRGLATAANAATRGWPRCALLCGPVMLAMVPANRLVVMIGGTAAVWWEQRHPRAWRHPLPIAVLLATFAVLLVGG